MVTPEKLIETAKALIEAKDKKENYKWWLDKLKEGSSSAQIVIEDRKYKRSGKFVVDLSKQEAHDIIFPKYCAIEKEIIEAEKKYKSTLGKND